MKTFLKIYVLTFVFFSYPFFLPAQSTIPIETKDNALVLQVNAQNNLCFIYYGKKLSNGTEYEQINKEYHQSDYTGLLNSAYTPAGSRNLLEPAISVTHFDGNKSLDLKYVSQEIQTIGDNVKLFTITLKDPVYDFTVRLNYKAYYKENVIEQWSVIRHNEKGDVVLDKCASANLYLRANSYWLRQFHGDWAKEMQPEETMITHGIKTLDTKLGTRPNLFQPPVFMISFNKPATEEEGSVLFCSVEWSGNFRADLELDYQNNLRIIAGINDYASAYVLKAKQDFTTPCFLTVFSDKGKGQASLNLHRWARNYKLVDGNGNRLTLLNNWEATYFDFNEAILKGLFKDARKLGVDLFLLDDGWFANKYPRNDDRAGLGDWQENKTKLPAGIASLIEEATNDSIKFGIWLEPEMVNPKSELYENHPDWVIKQPQRDEYYFRNQLVLDLTNPKVQDFVYAIVDNLLTKNPRLAYIKWDCNAVIYNAYTPTQKNQSNFYIDYVKGLYSVLERIRNKYPILPIMLCSGGGGRLDYGALQYFTEYWPSDNTDPYERIFIQWENSYFYPAIASCNHVTDWGKQPMKFKVDVAMQGKMGFDIVVGKLNEKDFLFCRQAIAEYNTIKQTIWHGDLFRLADPYSRKVASLMYADVSKNTAVMFNYLIDNRYGSSSALPIKLKGLDPRKTYKVTEINLYPGTKSSLQADKTYSGDFLMNIGINPEVRAGRASVVLKIEAV
ncbi:MAG: alpha-galactosidase [Candidatus Azobacteroides sp.]|nr:alpha-galactosidase [Candidatus Azobacteroides sp.]